MFRVLLQRQMKLQSAAPLSFTFRLQRAVPPRWAGWNNGRHLVLFVSFWFHRERHSAYSRRLLLSHVPALSVVAAAKLRDNLAEAQSDYLACNATEVIAAVRFE